MTELLRAIFDPVPLLEMGESVFNFFLWHIFFLRDVLFNLFFVWPPVVAWRLYQTLLGNLPPLFRECREGICEISDIGQAAGIAGFLGVIVWFLKNKKSRQPPG